MIIIRPTQNLARRMNVTLHLNAKKSNTILGDWYAQGIVFQKRQFILCMSEHGRLPVIMPAAPCAKFPNRLADQVLHVLRAIGIEESKLEEERSKMLEFQLGKTENRSILGTMKQFCLDLHYSNPPGGLNRDNPIQLSLFLANSGTLTLEEFHPKDAVLKLFGREQLHLRRNRPNFRVVK